MFATPTPPSVDPVQRIAPGAQSPEHPFSEHTVVQGTDGSHSPLSLQTELMLLAHFLSPGLQSPTHEPAEQMYGHVASTCQVPCALQTRSDLPEQSLDPGEHAPPWPASPSIDTSWPPPVPPSAPVVDGVI